MNYEEIYDVISQTVLLQWRPIGMLGHYLLLI